MIPATLILSVLINCPATKIVNPGGFWDDQDEQALSVAKKRCGQIYQNSPCLTTFKKIEEGVYTAICGATKK